MNNKLFKKCLVLLGMSALILIGISRYTSIDIALADLMFDSSHKEFVWRHNWFAVVFMHESMKVALIAFGLALIALVIASRTFFPDFLAANTRRGLIVVIGTFIIVPLAISSIKASSIHACPWDLARYGGTAPYLRLFDSLPVYATAGHCFPAGHAASGLWLAAFAVFWLPARPRAAAVMFFVGLIPGAILGWVQQMRGAHFLSHTLWSIWITGLVVALLARILYTPFAPNNFESGPSYGMNAPTA